MIIAGKRAMIARWKQIINDTHFSIKTPDEDRDKLKKLIEKPTLKKLYPFSEDEIQRILISADLSEETIKSIVNQIQFFVLELAKSNSMFFYDYIVEAEKQQLDGINEIKEALNIGEEPISLLSQEQVIEKLFPYIESRMVEAIEEIDHQYIDIKDDTTQIQKNQDTIISLLQDIKELIIVPEIIDQCPDTPEEPNLYHHDHDTINESINNAFILIINKIKRDNFSEASIDLLKMSSIFFNLYTIYKDKNYYRIGNRCLLLGRLWRQ